VEHDTVRRAELESQLESCEAQVESLAEANALLESRGENFEVVKLRRRIEQLEREREPDAHIARLNEDLQMQVVDLEECVSKLRAEIDSTAVHQRCSARRLAEQNCKLMELNDWKMERATVLEERVHALEGEKAQLELQRAVLEKQKEERATVLKERVHALEGELEERVHALEGEKAQLELQRAVLEKQKKSLKVQLELKSKRERSLVGQLDEAQKKIESLAEKVSAEQTEDTRSTASAERMIFIGDVDDQAASESDDWFFADTPNIR